MAKTKTAKKPAKKAAKKRRTVAQNQSFESIFILKMVLYLILGAQWIRFVGHSGGSQVPIPIGLIVGILFAMHDQFQIDRKIEYAILLVAMFVGFWSQVGIYITI
ncbi:MAG TPA: hypothetical protein VFL85_04600 [Candidatus Saccharimonadales bacterium]|nr:hypothetical protein [Candidatus Saccharimonadales bacterium]